MLSETKIKKLLREGTVTSGISDGNGLYLLITKSGYASFHFRYNFNGVRNKFSLGQYPDVSLKKARGLRKQYQQYLRDGVDPKLAKERERLRGLTTLNDVFEHYFETTIKDRYKHPNRLHALYVNNIYRPLGQVQLCNISGFDISDLVQKIKKGGRGVPPRPSIATDALYLIKNLYKHAIKLDIIRHNVALNFTAKDAGGTDVPKTTVLSLEELRYFLKVARGCHPSFSRTNYLACILLFVTCTRKMELLGSKWEEFDLERGRWNLPANRTKARRELEIPLSSLSLEVLQELRILGNNSKYVFPAKKKGKLPHLYHDTLNHAFKSLPLPFKFAPHDIRRTSRTLLAKELRVDARVAELCLNHKLPKLEGMYNQHSYFEERKDALEKLSELIKKASHFSEQ
tara:strand:+ start:460 stop:1659 length:1200 start_codon:yes stop_codon:yes gene_type:complete